MAPIHADGPRSIEDVICELYDSGHVADRIHNLVNFYDDGSRVQDVDGNVVPEVTIEFIRQVIIDYF